MCLAGRKQILTRPIRLLSQCKMIFGKWLPELDSEVFDTRIVNKKMAVLYLENITDSVVPPRPCATTRTRPPSWPRCRRGLSRPPATRSERDKWGQHYWGHCKNSMFFDRGTFWVPICQNL